jgi:hypothetical protein
MSPTNRFFGFDSPVGRGAAVLAGAILTLAANGRGAGHSCCGCLADIDGDGNVNGADLGLLIAVWDTSGSAENGFCEDVDFDGDVDGADLGILLTAWEDCLPNKMRTECEGDPPCGDAATHDCCATGGVGCTDEACCSLICAEAPFCCTIAWDDVCAGAAQILCECGDSPCPNPDHDCCTSGSAGCADAACCVLVCAADIFCCTSAWDTLCISEADALCGPALVCGAATHD